MKKFLWLSLLVMAGLFIGGCATESSNSNGTSTQFAQFYRTTDARKIDIGTSKNSHDGIMFSGPHMEKCWLAAGFNFAGYDTLYIAPVTVTAKYDSEAEAALAIAKTSFVENLKSAIIARGIFTNVLTDESAIKPEVKTLKLYNTITEFKKGDGPARAYAGIYGAGQPVLVVNGKMTEAGKSMFLYQMRRNGISAGPRTGNGLMRNEDVQNVDVASLILDLTDFMSAASGQYQVVGK